MLLANILTASVVTITVTTAFTTTSLAAATKTGVTWSNVKNPTQTTPNPIGSYSNGCIGGAISADLNNPYYQVIRQQNKRYFGHPELIDFLNSLGQKAHKNKLPILLVGDMSMPRGGPFKSGHASHQTGLDVDIWFRMVNKKLKSKDLNNPWAINIVENNWLQTNEYYTPQIYTLIKLAASDKKVERIFINPAIKKQLCEDTPVKERDWLKKIRPWWGHNAHMHIRLACPSKNSNLCIPQSQLPNTDGCDSEIDSWLFDIKHKKTNPQNNKPKKTKQVLPKQCFEILEMK
ncbi:MAG: penicillin-insensitive murein endopeptidase [Succinivibrionaceae bacterium]